MDFVTGGDLLWIMDFSQKQRFEVENILMMDLFLTQRLSLQDIKNSVNYCDVFISVWTLILTAPIHCRASIVEQVM